MRQATRHLLLAILLAACGSAHATFHIWHITQLYSNADGTIQFIELQAAAGGQQFIAGHTLRSSSGSTTNTFTFPSNLPGDTAMTSSEGNCGGYYGSTCMTSYRSMLIATQGFAALGSVTPDYIIPNGFLFTNGGTLNYAEASDTIAYASLPTDGQNARNRDGSMSMAEPMNFNGMTGTVSVPNLPGSLSGLWWDSQENGWGVAFTQRRNIIFVAWYTYDANGNPKWYVASNCTMPSASTTGTCTGTLYEVNGPTFFGAAFNPGAVNVVTAGSISIAFASANSATLTYTVGSQTRTVAITRQSISSGAIPGVDYTDLWYNPSESGWGMAITQQGSVMFLAWYVYDNAGKPMWYVASNCAVSGNGCSGTLYRTTGPAFGPAFDPTKIQVFTAGTVTLNFTDPNNGILTFTVDGVSGTKAITRQTF